MDVLSVGFEAAPKALVYASLLLIVGACVARLIFRFRVARAVQVQTGDAFEPALARVVLVASGSLVAALTLRAWTHTVVAFGVADAFTRESLQLAAWESRWGHSWRIQILAALVLVAGGWSIRSRPQAGWWFTSIAALTMCYLLPLLGHAAAQPGRLLIHGSHILGGGVWLGTLSATVLATAGASPPRSDATASPGAAWSRMRLEMLTHFSPVAFGGSAVLVTTGAVAAWWYLATIQNLVSSTYGRLLLAKLVGVAAVAGCGFVNWRRLRTRDADGRAPTAAFVTLEIALAVAVVLITAVLTETEHP